MLLAANVVRDAVAVAASLTASQPREGDPLLEIWLVCASVVLVSYSLLPSPLLLIVVNLAGPIPTRVRAIGAPHRS